jgi:hypothetical protein
MVRKRVGVSALALVAALAVAASVPAVADTGSFRDKRRDTRHPADIVSVKVRHTDRIVVLVHHRNLTFLDAPASIRVAYDTGRRYDGPEFYLRIAYQSDQSPELRTARGWGHLSSGPIPTCQGESVSVSALKNTTRVSVPRSCYGNPRRVRVHVRIDLRPGDGRAPDVAPRSRTMGPAVGFS